MSGTRATRIKLGQNVCKELAKRISTVPETVEMQSRVAKIYGDRQLMAAGEDCSMGRGGKPGVRHPG